jgi:glycosyltransferase involved in cell wall biosynthesis
MSDILLVSKPIAPPWTDGSKNLVRDLARAMTRHVPIVLGPKGGSFSLARGRVEPVYGGGREGFALGSSGALRVAARLASGARADLWHFFFAPNRRSSAAARSLAKLRRTRTVQTAASAPQADEDLRSVLFGDRIVALSRRTERRFLEAGLTKARVRRIPPAVAPLEVADAAARARARALLGLPSSAPIVVFPGDLEHGRGASLTLDAFATLPRTLDAMLVIASRQKTPRAAEAERSLRDRAERLGLGAAVRWIGETPHIHALLAAADVVALPAEDLVAKVDLPLVLIEAMWLGRPVVVAEGSSAADLAEGDGAELCSLTPEAVGAAIGQLLDDAEHAQRRSEAGQRAALQRYHPDTMARAYEGLYDELCG